MMQNNLGTAYTALPAALCGSLALLALVLSCIGLYGLMAYNVARRTGEMGIRKALGARPRDVAWPILREALTLAAIGVVIGLPVALATQNNLGNAYIDLLSATPEERAKNVRDAIECYRAALEIRKKDEYPVQYARGISRASRDGWTFMVPADRGGSGPADRLHESGRSASGSGGGPST